MRKLLLVIGFLVLILAIRFWFYFINVPQMRDGQEVIFKTTLLVEPAVVSNQQRFTATLPHGERVFIVTSQFLELGYGDSLVISGKVKKYLLTKGSIWTMSYPKIVKVEGAGVFQLVAPIRQKIIRLFDSSLSSDMSSLLLGIVFGIKESQSEDFSQALKYAGVLHIMAASGMNVTMTAFFISTIVGYFFSRRVALMLTLLAVFFYAIIAGLGASIVRASLMGSFVYLGQLFGRQVLAVYGLFLTAAVMLLLSPYLLFDVGFQLSFAATIGLLFLSPHIEKGIVKKLGFLREDVVATLAATLATLPILLYQFGSFPLVGLLANMLILWTIPILMVLGGVAAILGLVIPFLGKVLLFLTLPLLRYVMWVIMFVGRDYFMVSVSDLPIACVIGYYCVLVSVVLFLKKREEISHP